MKNLLFLFLGALLSGCGATLAIKSGDGRGETNVPLHVYEAGSRPAPTIILSPGCAGVTSVAMDKARELRNWGYNVVLVDSHGGRGYRSVCDNTTVIFDAERASDVVAAAQWAVKQAWHGGKVGMFGYSAGGGAGNHLSEREPGPIAAVVSYYPTCQVHEFDPKIPVQIHIGTADDWTPARKCQIPSYEAKRDIRYYEGAHHSFDVPAPRRTLAGHVLAYDAGAAAAAAAASKAFFDRHLR